MLSRIRKFLRYRLASSQERKRFDAAKSWKKADGDHTMRLVYPLHSSSVVIDAGGYHGQWASDIYSMYRCHIHVFEPVPAFADIIASRFQLNPNITLHRVALGDKDGKLSFSIDDNSSGTFAHGQHISVEACDAARYFAAQGLHTIDLLKLNIEGGEYDLIEHLHNTGILPNIQNIQVQFHPFVPDANIRLMRIYDLLTKTHRPTYQYRYVWENWSRI